MSKKLQILQDKETRVDTAVAGAALTTLIALDITNDNDRVIRGDIEFTLNLTNYTSGAFVYELVTADDAALVTNPVSEAIYRSIAAEEIIVIPVPQSITEAKNFVGVRATAVAHVGDVVAHAQSLQLRNKGR